MGFFNTLKLRLGNQMAPQDLRKVRRFPSDENWSNWRKGPSRVPNGSPIDLNNFPRGPRVVPTIQPKGITSLPQEDLNLDFLRSLPKNMLPNLDFSNIPQLPQNFKFNPQLGSIVPGYAWGGIATLGRWGKGLVDHILPGGRKIKGRGPVIPKPKIYTPKEIQRMNEVVFGNPMTRPNIGRGQGVADKVLSTPINLKDIPYQGMIGTKAGLESGKFTLGTPLTDSLRRGTENLIGGGILGGGLTLADATEGFTEAPSRENLDLSNYLRNLQFPPEELGKSLAGLGFKLDQAMSMVAHKAQEIGAPVVDYVNKAKLAYAQEMEDQRMRQIDEQQGLRHVIPSAGMVGPGGTEPIADLSPELEEILEGGIGRTTSARDEIPQLVPQHQQNELSWLNNISQ